MIQNIYIVKFPIDEDYLNDTKNDINSEITIKNETIDKNETIEEKKNNPDIIVQPDEVINDKRYKVIHFYKKKDLANLLNIPISTLTSLLSNRLKLIHTKYYFLKNVIVEKKSRNEKREKPDIKLNEVNQMKNILKNINMLY